MSRMYKTVDKTWNPYTGCLYECVYCWARELAEGKLHHLDKYKNGFLPALHERELNRSFKPGQFVAVSLMGDVMWAKTEWREAILGKVERYPDTRFLFQSRNPIIFTRTYWPKWDNISYGTTIETDKDYGLTKAPQQLERSFDFARLEHSHKFVSIEPICDFDLGTMLRLMQYIKPEIIEVGADNHGHHLPEPPWSKVEELLEKLREICPSVVEKDGLERLKGGKSIWLK